MTGKVALVTGAASAKGLGFSAASMMARLGASVYLTDISSSGVEDRASELAERGCAATAAQQDVTDEAQWADIVAAVVEKYGQLDILVNNAGIAVLRSVAEMTKAEWDRQLAVNLDSVFFGTRAAVRQMREQGVGGSIVNMSSVAGLVGVAGTSAYAASKGGVRLMSKTIALETASEGIRVNTVHPGMIWTEMQDVAIADNKDVFDQITAAIPMGKMGEPDDIGAMVTFLASDAAKYITGAEFVVDGGMVAQ